MTFTLTWDKSEGEGEDEMEGLTKKKIIQVDSKICRGHASLILISVVFV